MLIHLPEFRPPDSWRTSFNDDGMQRPHPEPQNARQFHDSAAARPKNKSIAQRQSAADYAGQHDQHADFALALIPWRHFDCTGFDCTGSH